MYRTLLKSMVFRVGVVLLILNFPGGYFVAIPAGIWAGLQYGQKWGFITWFSVYGFSWIMFLAGSMMAGRSGVYYAHWYWHRRMKKLARLKRWKELRAIRLTALIAKGTGRVVSGIGREVAGEVKGVIHRIEHRRLDKPHLRGKRGRGKDETTHRRSL